MPTTQMIIRLDQELKDKVTKIAKQEGKATGKVIRDLLYGYVRERDISSYIDDLWNRIGDKIASKGSKPEDINSIIKGVRKKER